MLTRFLRLFAIFSSLYCCVEIQVHATPDFKFDVATFCYPCSPDDHFGPAQFNDLNFPSTNGHYIAMGTDAHRMELATNGNALAMYYNTLNDGYSTNSAQVTASNINQWALGNFTTTGTRPDWIVLNEISSGMWTSDSNYRAWVRAVTHELRNTYGYSVILFSPFPNPGGNATDWQSLANDCYFGIENYIGGDEVKAHGYSVSYCQSVYQGSINSYTALGVPRAKLMLGEHFAQTAAGTGYGRCGIASNEWDLAISARAQAAKNIAFTGFLSYAWAKNAMLVSDDELIHFEDTYRTSSLPFNAGLTLPAAVFQPQSQATPEGGNVTFLVFPGGTTPTTYQWRFNGTNIPGATTQFLTVSNAQVSNSGNYSVVLANAAGTNVSSNAFLSVRVPDPQVFEPFAPSLTSYAPGAPLIGQTNTTGKGWTQAGPETNSVQPIIQPGNLVIPGLAGASGNSVKFGGIGTSARYNLGTNFSSGTWYYSMAIQLTDISTLNSGGVFWAGFNNSAGTQMTTPTAVYTRLLTRSTNGNLGYNIGLDKTSGTSGAFVWATPTFTTNDVVFIVASYTFNSGTTSDDVAQLWINPAASSFGEAVAPAPTLVATAVNDASTIASFVLFNRSASEPAGIIIDELRVGPSWASVTPPAEAASIPTLNAARDGNITVLSWSTNSPGFSLQSSSSIANGAIWNDLNLPLFVSGGQYFVTNSTAATSTFYRLREPQ